MPAPGGAVAIVRPATFSPCAGSGGEAPGAMAGAGWTTAPGLTVCDVALSTTRGVQPRFEPLIDAVAGPAKSPTWPDTVQPGLPARVSVTVTGLMSPPVVSFEPPGASAGVGRPTGLVLATLMVSAPAATVVVIVSEAVEPVNGVTTYGTAGDVEALNAVGSAGLKLAVKLCVPAAKVLVNRAGAGDSGAGP